MPAFPLPLIVRNHAADARTIEEWWDALPEADRSELSALWDRRGNDCRFTRSGGDGEPPTWHRLPLVEAEFTDESQPGDDWVPEWFDYLLSNVDLWAEEVRFRTFFIGCTAHPAARAALRAGFIPADFACPLGSAVCPMRKFLDRGAGRSVRLIAAGAGHPGRA